MNKTGLIAKISIKYVLPMCTYLEIFLVDFAVFRVFLGILQDFAEILEFCDRAKYQKPCIIQCFMFMVEMILGAQRSFQHNKSIGKLQSHLSYFGSKLDTFSGPMEVWSCS